MPSHKKTYLSLSNLFIRMINGDRETLALDKVISHHLLTLIYYLGKYLGGSVEPPRNAGNPIFEGRMPPARTKKRAPPLAVFL